MSFNDPLAHCLYQVQVTNYPNCDLPSPFEALDEMDDEVCWECGELEIECICNPCTSEP